MSSESENDIKGQHIEIASDETVTEEIEESAKPGRTPVHNIFKKCSVRRDILNDMS